MRVHVSFGFIAAMTLTGCQRGEDARAPGPPVPLKSFILHDVQGLSGGDALWVGEDNTAILQVVRPGKEGHVGLWEKRHKLKITDAQRAEVERLIGTHDFLRLRIKERYGVPDEAHPIIALVTKKDERVRVRKWANDKNARFDALYGYLLSLCRPTDERELIHEGGFDWHWRPDGFDKLW